MGVSTGEEVLCILTAILFWGIYIPICCLSIYQYYRQCNELVIINRRGLSSIITCFFLNIMIFLMGLTSLAHAQYIIFTLNFLYAFVHLGIYFSIFYRFFIIYFDFEWHNAMIRNNNWHQIINITYYNHEINWFIKNRNKLGENTKLAKIFIIIWFIASSITTALVMIELIAVEQGTFPHFFVVTGIVLCFLLFLILPCILTSIFYFKLIKFKKKWEFIDEFQIIGEITLIFRYSILHFIILFALIFMIDDFFITDIKNSEFFWLRMLVFHIVAISNCLFIILHTAYPLTSLKFVTFVSNKSTRGRPGYTPSHTPRQRSIDSKSNKAIFAAAHVEFDNKPGRSVLTRLSSIQENGIDNNNDINNNNNNNNIMSDIHGSGTFDTNTLRVINMDAELKDTGYSSDRDGGGLSPMGDAVAGTAENRVSNNDNNHKHHQREESLTRSVSNLSNISNVYGQSLISRSGKKWYQHNKVKENFYERERYLRKKDMSDIRNMLSHNESIEYLIKFLSFELNLSTIVALIEITQFKLYIINNTTMYDDNEDEKKLVQNTLLKFAKSVPASSILYHSRESKDFVKLKNSSNNINIVNNNSSNSNNNHRNMNGRINKKDLIEEIRDLKIIAFVLYCKYIRSGSEYEINLSYRIRRRFNRKFIPTFSHWITECKEFDNLTKLYHLFDDVESELKVLLYFTWLRFKKSPFFMKVEPMLLNQGGDWEVL